MTRSNAATSNPPPAGDAAALDRRTRTGLLVVALTMIAGMAIGAVSFVQYKHSVHTIEDLFTAIVYFMDDHGGRFPASQEELVQSGLLRILPDGGMQFDTTRSRSGHPIRPHLVGAKVASLERFAVPWGLDLGALCYEVIPHDALIVRDPANGHEVLALGEVASVQSRRRFTWDLLRYYCDKKGAVPPKFIRTGRGGHVESQPTSPAGR
ncbi:MAG: hypothetical protein SF069_14555 [Phycisphaerae bacterium]|nr:hypothetical protein [Phycisphaerae bacterium]